MDALKQKTALSLLVLAVLCVIGCGGSSNGEEVSTSKNVALPKGPTRQFYVSGEDNAVQLFGNEAAPPVRKQVSTIVQAWLHARAAGNWGKDCRYFTKETVRYATTSATTLSQRKVRDCDEALAIIAGKGLMDSRRYNMAGSVVSLRLEEGRGYAQYHGDDGRDWIVPVEREGGAWKIVALDPLDRLK